MRPVIVSGCRYFAAGGRNDMVAGACRRRDGGVSELV
jgi:hypothetical protein